MPPLSIIVTSYSSDRLNDIEDLLQSLKRQLSANYELVYVTEGDRGLQGFVSARLKNLGLNGKVLHNEGEPGLPQARNLGAEFASGEILCFLDDDVFLSEGWTTVVEEKFREHREVVGMTGPAYPHWVGKPADWLPTELDWLIGCTRWFSADRTTEVPNCWGMNMAFRRSAFETVGGFSTNSTENSRYLRTGVSSDARPRREHGDMAEDVDLSLRLRAETGGKIYYVPEMEVYNKVYGYRLSSRYIIQRASWVGFTRRNVNRNLRGPEFQAIRFEKRLIPGVLSSFAELRIGRNPRLGDIRKKYRVLLLCVTSLLIGYLIGPVES